ncbi:serine/threonine-protein kinase/endoribonuclease IRE1a-like isoform X2 [Tasmannia lanceolata]|uniref:serine/threonine-protein kinase/endoribonuclease IRE1a-like isoform X2 n=1 Tax=Tasmannia lanceolata TaxID=3420 RepID=UPI004064B66A
MIRSPTCLLSLIKLGQLNFQHLKGGIPNNSQILIFQSPKSSFSLVSLSLFFLSFLMKSSLFFLFFIFLSLTPASPDLLPEISSKYPSHSNHEALNNLLPIPQNVNNKGPPIRSMLSDSNEHDVDHSKHVTALFTYMDGKGFVATMDGTIYLLDGKSGKIHWSFSTGPPILSSSHQAILDDNSDDSDNKYPSGSDDYFIDVGDDWELYEHSKHFGSKKLNRTIEEYVNSMPLVSKDGMVIHGSKKTTGFVVDVMAGKVIRIHQFPDTQSMLGVRSVEENSVVAKQYSDELKASVLLYVTRTDYMLQSFHPNLETAAWNLSVAKFGASFLHQGFGSVSNALTFDSRDKLGLEYQDYLMSLLHAIKFPVVRIHDRNLIQPNFAHFQFNNVLGSSREAEMHNLEGEGLSPPPSDRLNNSSEIETRIDDAHNLKEVAVVILIVFIVIVIILLVAILAIVPVIWVIRWGSKQVRSDKQSSNLVVKESIVSQRRKTRRSRNNKSNTVINRQDEPFENEDAQNIGITCMHKYDRESPSNHTKSEEHANGRFVGQLFVSNTEIAKGSNGTVVFEGVLNGCKVAVKRLVRSHHDVAIKELEILIASHKHPNIVWFYGVEQDSYFVYLSLEHCTCSLNDLIQQCLETPSSNSISKYNVRLDSIKRIDKDIELWKANGRPSSQLLKLMRDVVSGLAYLHKKGIVHRDLKPQNVLISTEGLLCAKLSDMGISKHLLDDTTSFSNHATGSGSSGWQAPEQLNRGRQTRAVDLFSLGCVLFFCISGGKHPFGEPLKRDYNIDNNRFDLFLVEHIPEAVHIISHLLDPDPKLRPKPTEVLQHPLLWSSEMRLSFLRDSSDRVESETQEGHSDLLEALENVAPVALDGKWDEKMEASFITNIGRYRRYKYHSTRDLLRVIRNKLNHYGELPKEIQVCLIAWDQSDVAGQREQKVQ